MSPQLKVLIAIIVFLLFLFFTSFLFNHVNPWLSLALIAIGFSVLLIYINKQAK